MDLLRRFFEPYPIIYRIGPKRYRPLIAGVLTLGGLYGLLQVVRLATGNPWKGTKMVFNWGDPSLAIAAAAIAVVFNAQEEELPFELTVDWYLLVTALALVANTATEVYNVASGTFPLAKEKELGQIVHFLETPIWAAILVGPLPMLVRLRGSKAARVVIVGELGFYTFTLIKSM